MNKPLNRRRLAITLALVPGALLGACSASLVPKPKAAASRYTLDDGGSLVTNAAAAAGAPVLLLAQPAAAAGYDTARMVYLRDAQQMETFAFHEWVEAPALMLAPLLLHALQGTAAFRAVLMAPSAARSPLRMETELLRLYQDFSVQPSRLRLALRAVLLDTVTREVLGSQVFEGSLATRGDDPVSGVIAAQALTQTVLGRVAAASALWARARRPDQ